MKIAYMTKLIQRMTCCSNSSHPTYHSLLHIKKIYFNANMIDVNESNVVGSSRFWWSETNCRMMLLIRLNYRGICVVDVMNICETRNVLKRPCALAAQNEATSHISTLLFQYNLIRTISSYFFAHSLFLLHFCKNATVVWFSMLLTAMEWSFYHFVNDSLGKELESVKRWLFDIPQIICYFCVP